MERTYTIEDVEQALERLRTPSIGETVATMIFGENPDVELVKRYALAGALTLIQTLQQGLHVDQARRLLLQNLRHETDAALLLLEAEEALRTPPRASREG